MDVWIVEWSNRDDGETEVSIWSNEQDAQKQAAQEISAHIQGSFDFDDTNEAECTEEFNDYMSRKDYVGAMRRFHDHQDNYNPDYGQYWFVYKKPVLGDAATVAKSISTHVSSNNGATCRGPCRQHNPYANADKADGTYVCSQCKTFKNIFGTP